MVSGDDFLASLDDAVNTSLVVLAIMESAKKGNSIEVEYLK
jgi:hypothetical protein